MSGQELVAELRNEKWEAEALARPVNWRLYKRAADRIEAQAKELDFERGRCASLAGAADRAEQKSAELAAVIAEALAALETTGIHEAYNILSAVPADALSAYTTRIREEAWEQAAQISEAVAADWAMTYQQFAADKITKAIRALSEIPEGQNNE